MWRVGWVEGFKRSRMAANITFQAAPTENLDVERYFSVFAGRERQFSSQPIKFGAVRCGCNDNVFCEKWRELQRLCDFIPEFILGEFFAHALQFALHTDDLLWISVTDTDDIDASLFLSATAMELSSPLTKSALDTSGLV